MITFFRSALFLICLSVGISCFAASADNERVTLNLKDADITAFIGVVGEVTGKTFIIDPRVKGKVTIISQHPMAQNEVYQVFLSTLKVHGYTAVEAAGAIKVIPIGNVKEDVTTVATARNPGSGDEYVTRIIQLNQVSAFQILPLIKPMAGKEAHLAAYAPSNALIIVDRAENVQRIVNVVNKIDKSSKEDVEVIPLKYASAKDVLRVLQQMDKPISAADIVPDKAVQFVAVERTNSILVSGSQTARLRIRAVIAQLDTEIASNTSNIKVIYLHNAKAVDLVKVLDGMKPSISTPSVAGKPVAGTAAATKDASNINIQADEATNSLVISAQPDVMRSLEKVIKKLDIRRAQVLVEAIIVEITQNRSEELGIQWLFGGPKVLQGGTVFPGSSGPNPIAIAAAASGNSADLATALAGITGLNIGAGHVGSNGMSFGALLHAISTDDGANVLSTPSIITMDNEEASIMVGQEVPFVTGSTTANNTNPFQTITREQVGIKLTVLPQINEGNAVRLGITQEVSSVTEKVEAQDLVTNKREIKTTVFVEDGATIVLGGLISEDQTENQQKVPLLGDVPVFGQLFKSTVSRKLKSNLLVFIRPTIIRSAERLDEISGRKYSYIRQQQLDLQEEGVALMADETSPVLPEWNSSEILPWRVNIK